LEELGNNQSFDLPTIFPPSERLMKKTFEIFTQKPLFIGVKMVGAR
jgi:hypothetical protein